MITPAWAETHDRMPEAEVAIRLAEYLCELPQFGGVVDVAIDGASIRVHGADVFNIRGYLSAYGWQMVERDVHCRNDWAATYRRRDAAMCIHSRSGVGDVVASVAGRRIIAECKKGPLVKVPGSKEYPLLTSALGQALLFQAEPEDVVVAAVPDTPAFRRIASVWRERPRIKLAGLQIALVARSGEVSGLTIG